MSPDAGPIDMVLLSYHVTEESGGPAVAAAGFARALARRGNSVSLLALSSAGGRWLLDERDGSLGFHFRRVPGETWFDRRRALVESAMDRLRDATRPIVWVNGIWGVQSLAAAEVARTANVPLVVRPAGSLGRAALEYKRLKKLAYFVLIERPVLEIADAIHCMTEQELGELPGWLRDKAFVVPTGADLPIAPRCLTADGGIVIGVLARIHPIKRQHLVLDVVESLVAEGCDLRLEFAGTTSDVRYRSRLETRIRASEFLRDRVSFLGHVGRSAVAEVVGRWRAALLLSEQENFGHAVVTAAALGVPTVVSPGVGLACAVQAAGAGRMTSPSDASGVVRELLESSREGLADACRRFASGYSWEICGSALENELRKCIERREGKGQA